MFEQITAKLSVLNQASLDALLILGSEEADGSSDTADEEDDLRLSALRADPGRIGVKSIVNETAKLERLDAIGLPHGLFTGTPTSFIEKVRRPRRHRTTTRAAASPRSGSLYITRRLLHRASQASHRWAG